MAQPVLCFVGPMIGRKPGRNPTQSEVLADLFVAAGWTVRETSSQPGRPLRLLDTLSCLLRWWRSIDVVVLSVFSGPAFIMADLTCALTRFLRLPTIMVLHGGNLPDFERRHPRWVRRVLDRADLVVSPSPYLATEVAAARDRTTVIPNVLDLDGWDFRCRRVLRPKLLWMRTFHPVYAPEVALRVLQRVRADRPDAVLTMAGQDKGELERTRALVTELGLIDAVAFPGFLDEHAKARAFDEHDLYLHTNRVDNTPVSVLEAAAAGLPVVGTTAGGMPYLLEDGRDAVLVPPDDVEALATAVERVLADPDLAEALSTNAHQLVAASAWPAVLEQWQHAFDQVLTPS